MTIVEFLSARLDEQEAGIRGALKTEEYGVSQFDLDDVEAKRRIVRRYRDAMAKASEASELDPNTQSLLVAFLWPLYDLAAPYSYHSDYDSDWKP